MDTGRELAKGLRGNHSVPHVTTPGERKNVTNWNISKPEGKKDTKGRGNKRKGPQNWCNALGEGRKFFQKTVDNPDGRKKGGRKGRWVLKKELLQLAPP